MDKNVNENSELSNELNDHDKFVEKLKVFPYNTKGFKDVYAKINKCSNDEIVVSLINDAMLKADKAYFSDKNVEKEYYVPYVYEFVVDKSYEEKILNIAEFSKWYLASLSTNIDSYNGGKSIKGSLYFMASVFDPQKNIYLIFKNSTEYFDEFDNVLGVSKESGRIDTIKEKYYINTYSLLSDEILKNASKYDYTDLTVYNVGQGNMVYISDRNNKYRILFDVGVEKSKIFNSHVEKYLKKMKPSMIILSHWDLDHILSVKFIKDENWPRIWITPDIIERKGDIILSAHRLAMYLSKNNMLYMVSGNYDGKIVFELKNLRIYKGNADADGAGKEENDYNNNHGLILTIKNGNCNAVLPGDCEYMAWPESISLIKNEYDILLVPHHGALCNLKDSEYSNDYMLGIISYGSGNVHKHPSGEMMLKISNKYNCDIIGTEGKKYIRIELLNNRYRAILKYEDFEEEINVFKVEQYHRVEKISRNFVSNIVSERLR